MVALIALVVVEKRLTVRTRESSDGVVLYVIDNGPEISRASLPHLFSSLEADEAAGGLGLGVAHALVRDHGGHIWADSVAGQGSAFYVRLPRCEPYVESAARVDGPSLSGRLLAPFRRAGPPERRRSRAIDRSSGPQLRIARLARRKPDVRRAPPGDDRDAGPDEGRERSLMPPSVRPAALTHRRDRRTPWTTRASRAWGPEPASACAASRSTSGPRAGGWPGTAAHGSGGMSRRYGW